MGFLQNRAIKKSCSGLATELLNHVENFAVGLPADKASRDFDQLMYDALKNFIDTFRPLPGINFEHIQVQNSNWKDLYLAILIIGVQADLAYDPNIGTEEHKSLIVEVSIQIFDSWIKNFH